MDERELSTLFRAAPGDPPAPTFDLADITAASARARARRRHALLAAVTCVVLALVGFGVSRIPFAGPSSGSSQVASPGQPGDDSGRLPYVSTPSPMQGSDGTGEAGPRAESAFGCEKVDRALATALAGELPDTGVLGPEPSRICPAGSRSAGFRVVDGDRQGVLSVALAPPDSPISFDPGGAVARQRAASGASVVVFSAPDPGSLPPLQADLDRIARALASRF